MKNYAKVGKRQGRPAYRTPASFRYRKHLDTLRRKIRGDTQSATPWRQK